MDALTVREINNRCQSGRPVWACWEERGQECHGRIIAARVHEGHPEGKVLNSGRWVRIWDAQAVT